MNIKGLEIHWKGHDCFSIKTSKGIIYIDPFELKETTHDADYIFITHEHFDHCHPESIGKIIKEDTIIIATPDCQSKLSSFRFKALHPVEPNKNYTIGELNIETVPSYNTNKFRSPGQPFHPKEDGKVGYLITIDNKRLYHAGDTDHIAEMKDLHNIDIAFVPVSGTYVMTAQEAAEAVNNFRPALAIPMHYGSIVGSKADAETFKNASHVPVQILEKE
ncbi:MBL fold metallo-hydrolase [Candidatus Woesearchaeota archaeon]|nr:MBL fold metallo-hydrolase [Candidatus Woesearchaeota archaeon]